MPSKKLDEAKRRASEFFQQITAPEPPKPAEPEARAGGRPQGFAPPPPVPDLASEPPPDLAPEPPLAAEIAEDAPLLPELPGPGEREAPGERVKLERTPALGTGVQVGDPRLESGERTKPILAAKPPAPAAAPPLAPPPFATPVAPPPGQGSKAGGGGTGSARPARQPRENRERTPRRGTPGSGGAGTGMAGSGVEPGRAIVPRVTPLEAPASLAAHGAHGAPQPEDVSAFVRSSRDDRGEFTTAIADFLRYPLQAGGLSMVIVGGVFFGLAQLLREWAGLFGASLGVIITGYLFAYQFKAIKTSALGAKTPPDWPDIEEAGSTIFPMIGCTLASFGVPTLLLLVAMYSFADSSFSSFSMPAPEPEYQTVDDGGHSDEMKVQNLARFYQENEGMPPDVALKQAREDLGVGPTAAPHTSRRTTSHSYPTGPSLPLAALGLMILAGLTGLFGVAYYPMALLITAMLNTSRPAFNYVFGFTSALRILPQYVICAAVMLGSMLAILAVQVILTVIVKFLVPVPLIDSLLVSVVVSTVGLYQLLATSHLIGRLFYHTERQLGWFDRV